jgi:hypothetical protein
MSAPVRVVVADGPSTRKGLLRFVLEGEGYDVIGDAATSAELARSVAVLRPDVVVMDDGIGAMAVSMIRAIAPSTRVILVWPGVVPIGGDARVEPSQVLRELGRTVERLTGQPRVVTVGEASGGPDGGRDERRDAATLRAILARGESARLQRLHPSRMGDAPSPGDTIVYDRQPAPVVILPTSPLIDRVDHGDEAEETADVVVVPQLDEVAAPVAAAERGPAHRQPATDPTEDPSGGTGHPRHPHKR